MIIFGTKDNEKRRGVIAEICDACDAPRVFFVLDHYEAPHVYWVTVGSGTRKGTSMQCTECGAQFHFNENIYSGVLTPESARDMTLDDIIQHTNPRLAKRLQINVGATKCKLCEFERDRKFKFCPKCGTEAT